MDHPFCHVELMVADPTAAVAFYKKMFGWKFQTLPMAPGMDYHMFQTGKDPGGGIMGLPQPGIPPCWMAYVLVPNVATALEKAKKLGAQVMQEKMAAGEFGWFGVIIDPQGAALALWQPKPAPKAKPASKAKPAPKTAKKPSPKAKKTR